MTIGPAGPIGASGGLDFANRLRIQRRRVHVDGEGFRIFRLGALPIGRIPRRLIDADVGHTNGRCDAGYPGATLRRLVASDAVIVESRL